MAKKDKKTTQKKGAFSFKKLQMDRDQRLGAIAIMVIFVVIIVTLTVSVRFLSINFYQKRAIEEIEDNISELEQIKEERNLLIEQYQEFVKGSVIAVDIPVTGRDKAYNQEIALRSLPYIYSEPELDARLRHFIDRDNQAYEYDFSTPSLNYDPTPKVVAGIEDVRTVEISVTVSNLKFECVTASDTCLEKLFQDLDRSSFPLKVISLNMEFQDRLVGPDDDIPQEVSDIEPTLEVSLVLEAYIKPREEITVTQEFSVDKNKPAETQENPEE